MNVDRKAVVIANKALGSWSIIDIEVFDVSSGRLLARPTKNLIDDINRMPLLDRKKIREVVAKQYGVSEKNVTFSK